MGEERLGEDRLGEERLEVADTRAESYPGVLTRKPEWLSRRRRACGP